MPIYEYTCKCGTEREFNLPFSKADQAQVCECGEVMQKKISASSFTMKPTGRGMALETLNSNVVGGRRKDWAEKIAAQGL